MTSVLPAGRDPLGESLGLYDVHRFGAVGDGATDDLPAFEATLDAIRTDLGLPIDGSGNSSPSSAIMVVPPGDFFLDGTLLLDHPVILRGVGTGNTGETASSKLTIAEGHHGIKIVQSDTGTRHTGRGTIIDGLLIKSTRGATADKHGIWVENVYVQIVNTYIQGFTGHGVYLNGQGDTQPNVNLFRLDSVGVQSVDGSGFYMIGTNSNAGLITRCDAQNCGRWGFEDRSFLGNTYVQCHTAYNTLGGYTVTGENAYSVLLGCYSEGGQPESQLAQRCLILGGDHGGGYVTDSSNGMFLLADHDGLAGGGLVGHSFVTHHPGGGGYPAASVRVGSKASYPTMLGFFVGAGQVTFVPTAGSGAGSGMVQSEANNSSSYPGLAFVLAGSKDYDGNDIGGADTTRVPAGSVLFPAGFFAKELGGNKIIKHRHASAAPASGTWQSGDIVYNSAPSGGEFVGWICTTSGTPGTWKGFGLIEA